MISSMARKGKVDVRIDEEQNVKLLQIIKLLNEAGYYRARIKGLSPFDKIVGGMTWCIEVCNFDIDVDLLFHDSLTIGQKISLTERIVKVLPSMKCPHPIEPHQIQGLDSIHIYPVIKWLVKLAIETRTEYQDETRIIALDEFRRQYRDYLHISTSREDFEQTEIIRKLKLQFGPRIQCHHTGTEAQNINEKVLITLMEYSVPGKEKEALKIDADDIGAEEKELQLRLAKKMQPGINPSDRSRPLISAPKPTAQSSTDSLSIATKQLATQTAELNVRKANLDELKCHENELKDSLGKIMSTCSKLHDDMEKYHSFQLDMDNEEIAEVAHLLEENEAVKKRIATFKEACLKEDSKMKEKISCLEEKLSSPEEKIDSTLLDLHAEELGRLSKFECELAKKTREIHNLKRKIDDVPGRAELAQYQRRFVELYNQVSAKHHETLQFYNLYNTLADSKTYLEKELGLLNSIHDNMQQGLASSSNLEDFIHQLEVILEGIRQNKIKLERNVSEANAARNSISSDLNRLQELQLLYSRLLHQFSQEISKNEMLHSKLVS